MLSIQKLRSIINVKLKEFVSLDLVKYSLRTVTNSAYSEHYIHTTIDIQYIEIDSSIRNKGFGKRILKTIIETMFENSIDCIVITASSMYNTDFNKLVCLYKSLGFKEIKGGVKGAMYMINNKSAEKIQRAAEYDIIEASRLQQAEDVLNGFK